MEDRFKFRIPMFSDKDHFCEFQYIELGDEIECTLCGHNGEPQQCIGKRDKNGNLIYDGDIVNILAEIDTIGIIKWSNDLARFTINFENIQADFDNYYDYELEVIGNIYENKKLLRNLNNEF